MAVDRDVRTTAVTPDVATMQVQSNVGVNRRSYSRIPLVLEIPNLVQIQLESFQWFVEEGLRELLEEISSGFQLRFYVCASHIHKSVHQKFCGKYPGNLLDKLAAHKWQPTIR